MAGMRSRSTVIKMLRSGSLSQRGVVRTGSGGSGVHRTVSGASLSHRDQAASHRPSTRGSDGTRPSNREYDSKTGGRCFLVGQQDFDPDVLHLPDNYTPMRMRTRNTTHTTHSQEP